MGVHLYILAVPLLARSRVYCHLPGCGHVGMGKEWHKFEHFCCGGI